MTEDLESALRTAERWPFVVRALKDFAAWNQPNQFVQVLKTLGEQTRRHGATIVSNRDQLVSSAPRIVTLKGHSYPHASAAAHGLALSLRDRVWFATDFKNASEAFAGNEAIHFEPDSLMEPAKWADCMSAVAEFFAGGWWEAETASTLSVWVEYERTEACGPERRDAATDIPPAEKVAPATPAVAETTKKGTKRSTVRGEAKTKIIAALTKHHRYADGSCLNPEPAGVNSLANSIGVSSSTVSEFFKREFNGWHLYRTACRSNSELIAALKLLNAEFAPRHLLGDAAANLPNSEV